LLHSATSIFFTHAIAKEFVEHLPGNHPILLIDAIFHLGSLYLSLYQPGILQFLQMLRDGSLRYRQFLLYVAKITSIPLGQEVQYRYPRRMSQSLRKAGYLLLVYRIILFNFLHIAVCSSQNYEQRLEPTNFQLKKRLFSHIFKFYTAKWQPDE
jgi:hypothetical protein